MAVQTMKGSQKAAALLIALGSELSAEVLKRLSDLEIERVTAEIFSMERIPQEVRSEVLDECIELARAQGYVSNGGKDYAREMLTQALGPQRASDTLTKVSSSLHSAPFDFVRQTDPAQLVGFLQGERPQTIALVLAHLPPPFTATILARLDPAMQAEVVTRLAGMERTTPEAISQVEMALKQKLSSVLNQDYSSVGGVPFLVKVLTQVNRDAEKSILDALDSADPILAEDVRKRMFVFEDLLRLDDRSIQRVLRETDAKDLALSLKGCSGDVKERIFRNMSTRAAQMLTEDMEVGGPVRLKTVEEAQQRVIAIVRRLEQAEEIVISRGDSGDDTIV